MPVTPALRARSLPTPARRVPAATAPMRTLPVPPWMRRTTLRQSPSPRFASSIFPAHNRRPGRAYSLNGIYLDIRIHFRNADRSGSTRYLPRFGHRARFHVNPGRMDAARESPAASGRRCLERTHARAAPRASQAARLSGKTTDARQPPGHPPAIDGNPFARRSASDATPAAGQSMATATDSRDSTWYSAPAARMMAASASISVW